MQLPGLSMNKKNNDLDGQIQWWDWDINKEKCLISCSLLIKEIVAIKTTVICKMLIAVMCLESIWLLLTSMLEINALL